MDENKLNKIIIDLDGALKPGAYIPSDFYRNLFADFPDLLAYLDQNYSSTKDQLEEERTDHPATPWEKLGLRFLELSYRVKPFLDLSRHIYEHWYHHQVNFELSQKERTIHKGTPAHNLGIIWQENNNPEKARQYFFLGLIEDILESLRVPSRDPKRQQGYRVLKTSFNLTDSQYQIINKKVVTASGEQKKFPEDVRQIILSGDDRMPTWQEMFTENLNEEYLNNLYSKISLSGEPGTAFENFTEKLLGSVSGFFVIPEVKIAMSGSKKKENDYDRIIRNRSSTLSDFGTYILVECKYWDKPVTYEDIAKFIYKLTIRRFKSGILFAKSGVINDKYNPTIRDGYLAHDTAVMVVTEENIKDILDSKRSLTALLVDRYEEVRFHI